MTDEHPFKPGTRVAITSRYSETPREAFVDKVHKTGRFTLVGATGQWRPHQWFGGDGWGARQCGSSSWDSTSLRVWDDRADKAVVLADLERRVDKVRRRLETIKRAELTPEMVEALETAIAGKVSS